jgi:hypothetical protein
MIEVLQNLKEGEKENMVRILEVKASLQSNPFDFKEI